MKQLLFKLFKKFFREQMHEALQDANRIGHQEQRMKNRDTARWLSHQHKCPNCFERGGTLQLCRRHLKKSSMAPPQIHFWYVLNLPISILTK